MAKKPESTELATQSGASSLANVGVDIRNSGIRLISKDESVATQALDPVQLMEMLAAATDATQAGQLLHKAAGLIPFANKREIAQSGLTFSIRRLVIREKGGFTGKDDIAALIATQHGELQVLTFEQNPGRNEFMAGLNLILNKFGEAPNWSLQLFGDPDDETKKHFYALVPSAFWAGNGETLQQRETVEAEYTQV